MITSHIISASHAVIFSTLLYLHMKDKLDDTICHIPCALSHPIYGSFALPLFLSFSLQTLLLSLVHMVTSPLPLFFPLTLSLAHCDHLLLLYSIRFLNDVATQLRCF